MLKDQHQSLDGCDIIDDVPKTPTTGRPVVKSNSSSKRHSSLNSRVVQKYLEGQQSPTETPTKTPHERLQIQRRSSYNYGSPLPSPNISAERFYDFIGLIGEGITSRVYMGVNKKTGEEVAIKVIDKRMIINNKELASEVALLKRLSHPCIVELKDAFITQDSLQIIMELCQGQELFDEIVSRKSFYESDAKEILRLSLGALEYLHKKGISHGDLKPENIMFVSENGKTIIKLVDFGFARMCDDTTVRISSVGTLGYKAPEIFNKEPLTTQSDMWSIGVIAYILLCGFPPFCSDKDMINSSDAIMNTPFWFFFNDETESLIEQITSGNISFPSPYWDNVSAQAKKFVSSLLVVDPKKRMTATDALNHSWMNVNSKELEADKPVTQKLLKKLRLEMKRTRTVRISMSPDVSTENLLENHILHSFKDSPSRELLKTRYEDDMVIQDQVLLVRSLDEDSFRKYMMTRKYSQDNLQRALSRKLLEENGKRLSF